MYQLCDFRQISLNYFPYSNFLICKIGLRSTCSIRSLQGYHKTMSNLQFQLNKNILNTIGSFTLQKTYLLFTGSEERIENISWKSWIFVSFLFEKVKKKKKEAEKDSETSLTRTLKSFWNSICFKICRLVWLCLACCQKH